MTPSMIPHTLMSLLSLRSYTMRIIALTVVMMLSSQVSIQASPGLSALSSVRQTFNESNQELLVEFPNGYNASYGFHSVRIQARNTTNKPAVWEVSFQDSNRYGQGKSLVFDEHREVIQVAPGRMVERELLVASGQNGSHNRWSYFQVNVRMPSGARDQWYPNSSSSGRSHDINRVSVPTLFTSGAMDLTHGGSVSDEGIHSRLTPGAAASDWRAYSPYGVIILTPKDWRAMPATARTALGDWTRMGGHLQFLGGIPKDAPATDTPDKPARGFGAVYSPPNPSTPSSAQPNSKKNRTKRGSSFDNFDFHMLPATRAAMRNPPPIHETSIKGQTLLAPWLSQGNQELLDDRFTVWPMVLVLIAFFVMITPINLFVLAPSRRRYRLFRTIPIISIVTCLTLALAVLFGDGIGGDGKRLVWIESRPGTENLQYVTQWQASKCGALISTSFTVPDAAFIAPLTPLGDSVSLSVGSDRLGATGGWFTSRSTQAHFLQAVRPSRGRVEWSDRGDGNPSVVSTFSFPLRDIYIKDADGNWWATSTLLQGEKTRLQPTNIGKANDAINKEIHSLPQEIRARAMAHRSGQFIAFTDSPPAIDTLGSIDWIDTGIVTGVVATP